jgi:hypothetical protein
LARSVYERGLFSASATSEDKHAHFLTKVNIQMCRDCHRFYIISYEKNEKGQAVETSYELDIGAKLSGIVRPQSGDWETDQAQEMFRRKKDDDRRDLSCF